MPTTRQAGDAGSKKGLPATPDAIRAYAERVLRPGQVQSFGVVLVVGSGSKKDRGEAAQVDSYKTRVESA